MSNAKSLSPLADRSELATLLLQLFKGRSDRVGVGTTSTMSSAKIDSALTVEEIEDYHLAQEGCLAIYPLLDDGSVWFTCLDLDDKDHNPDAAIERKVRRVVDCLSKLGLEPLVERSPSGRGFHIWIFFSEPVAATTARVFWQHVCRSAGVRNAEIFPKQATLKSGQVGNCIRVPLFNKSEFLEVRPADFSTADPLKALQEVRRLTAVELVEIADRNGWSLVTETSSQRNVTDNMTGISPRVSALLAEESGRLRRRWDGDTSRMNDTSRSAVLCALAAELIRQFIPTTEIRQALEVWCKDQNYEKGLREGYLDRMINNTYVFVAENFKTVSTRR